MRRKVTFQLRLYSLFAFSIIVPIVIATALVTTYVNSQNIQSIEQQTQNITDQIAVNIYTYYHDLENVINTPALYNDILAVLKALNRGYYIADILEQNRLQSNYINTFTKLIFTNSNPIDSIRFFPANQNSHDVFDINKRVEGLHTITLPNYHESYYFKKATVGNGSIFLSDIYNKDINGSNRRMFSAIKKIKDYDNMQTIGVLQLDVASEAIEKMIRSIATSKNSLILLKNNESILYASKDYDEALETILLESPVSFEINSHRFRTNYAAIPNSDWSVAYVISENDLAKSNYAIYFLSAFLAFLTIVVAFFIFKKASNQLIFDISSIVSTLKRMRGGDLRARAKSHKDNSLESIARAINEMAIDLEQHIRQEFLAVVEQKNAENRALQSQINPHFLYNTLNCILALNRMGERNKTETAILNLSRLFQYTSTSEKHVTIKTEFDFLEKYINLQQIHFEDTLFYEMHIDKGCEKLEIPKLILQPLVENCIIHGIGSAERTMLIEISVTYCEGTGLYTILLKDNGIGFNPDDSKENIGLSNVKERLLLWKDNVNFMITSKESIGTIITITFCE